MKRRTFVFTSLAALGTALSALYFWRGTKVPENRGRTMDESRLSRKIRDRLPMLYIPSETLEAFTQDYEEHRGTFKGKRASHSVVQKFLLSTNFFPEANESKPLHYVTYYDPYLSPCRNPFRGTP